MKINKILFGFLFLIFFFSFASAYQQSSFQLTQPGSSNSAFSSGSAAEFNFNSEVCTSGQDFIIRIVPGGCTPPVVRSDLLEEQNVPVYCQLQALKVNPLITVTSIKSIDFGANLPEGVSSVGFIPSYPALGLNTQLSGGQWNNIGYVVIFLRQNKNESSMPESITGGLSARITYDLRDSFGLENYRFYLPLLTDTEFKDLQGQYAFFNHMGYLRADDIQTTSATISIYSGLNKNLGGVEQQKVLSKKLDVGEESSSFFLPGFGCMASSSLKLDSIQGQDTRAVLGVNSEIFEVAKGEFFYDNKCQVVSDPVKQGLRQTVDVRCEGDDKTQTFSLRIEPKIKLEINGVERDFQVGDYLGYEKDDKSVYLGYVGTNPNAKIDNLKNSLIYLVTVPGEKKSKLDSDTLDVVARYAETDLRHSKDVSDYLKTIFGYLAKSWDWLKDGNNIQRINYGSSPKTFGKQIQIKSFGVGTNLNLKNQTLIGYKNNAVRDYKQVQDNFANQQYEEKLDGSLGENALAQLVNLSNELFQNEDLKKYCDDFKIKYPNSNLDVSPCNNIPKYSNVGVSSQTLLIDGDYKEISFEGIHDPSFEDYGIEINIKKGEEVLQNPIQMRKGDIVYLGNLFKSSTDSATQQTQIFTMNKPGGSGVLYLKYEVPLNQPLITYQSPKIGWLWSPDKSVWMDTSEYKVVSGSFKDYTLPQESITFLNSLKGKNFEDGQFQITDISSGASLENSNTQEYIKLNEIKDEKWASLDFSLQGRSTLSSIGAFLTSTEKVLEKNVPYNVDGTDYTFVITKINLKKVAKVSVHTSVRDISNINFNFTLGIEKRSIQLSPEETKARIESWTNRINVLQGISDNLGTVVKTFQTTCEITGAVLTLKNLLLNSGVEALARKNVMNGEKGWNSYCESQINIKYSTKEQCLFDNSDKIEAQVEQVTKEMDKQNEELKLLQEVDGVTNSGGLFGQDIVDQTALMDKGYSNSLITALDKLESPFLNPNDKTQVVDVKRIETYLTGKYLGTIYSLEDAKQIELYANLYSQNPSDLTYKKRLFTLLYGVQKNIEGNLVKNNADNTIKESGLKDATVRIYSDKNSIEGIYDGAIVPKGFGAMIENEPVQPIVYESVFYYVTLKPASSGEYYINEVYGENKQKVSEELSNKIKLKYSSFKKTDTSEGTPIINPEVKYYETDPYKGLPALIPVLTSKGWYAYIPQTVSASSSSRTYDLSARINSFWICNAGSDGIMEYNPMEDSPCQLINLGNSNSYSQIGTLKGDEAMKIVNTAVRNIEKASRAYKDGIKNIKFDEDETIPYNVGVPAFDTPTIECTDIMSPTDCKILFNACDPVICPSSRCNFGGEYTVRDVVQSGIVGSIALCLPNWNEGIYVPVCLTGVKAGVDNFLSVAKSYRECLNTSLNTGATVGICDEINSIYMCEFFWRQALPLLNLAVPKIDSLIFGGGGKGGGEYIGGIQGALQNAKDSANYLVQYYSLNANSAFKARSQEEVGSLVCKNFLSVVYPEGQGALDALTQSRSPPQFTAKFDVIPFSSVTNPPQVQYKVFYHIFAGNGQGAYYRVYLKGDGSSYYSDSSSPILVDSGYLAPGEYETQTKDFTAAEGYKQLCVQVNNQEECGFGTVSTDFAVDYLGDQYIINQANNTNIESQSECISGSPNLISLLNPNLEAGVSNAISPDLASEGITRVCATENPGKGSDLLYPGTDQRWIDVGYCGNIKMRCWIDKQSISSPNVLVFNKSRADTLTSLGATLSDNLKKQNGMLSDSEFEANLTSIEKETDPFKKIIMIENIYEKVLESNKKGFLLFLRGSIYKDLAFGLYKKYFGEGEVVQSACGKDLTGDPYKDILTCTLALEGKYIEGILSKNYILVDYIYTKSNALRSCQFMDKPEKEYLVDGNVIKIGISPFEISPGDCDGGENADQDYKFGNLVSGKTVAFYGGKDYYGKLLSNQAVFIGWADREGGIASLFGVERDTDKIYNYFKVNLSDGSHPIYAIWNPLQGTQKDVDQNTQTIVDSEKQKIITQGGGLEQGVKIDDKTFISNKYAYYKKNSWAGLDFLSSDDNYCYQFVNGEWKWSISCDETVTNLVSGGRDPKTSTITVSWENFNANLPSGLISLKGKTIFVDGIGVLVNSIGSNSEAALSAGNVKLVGGIFTVGIIDKKTNIFTKFDLDKGWLFDNFGTGTWSEAYLANIYASSERIDESHKKLIFNLEGKNLVQGSAMIFQNKIFDFGIKSSTSSLDLSNCQQYYPQIKEVATKYNVDPNLVLAVMYKESYQKDSSGKWIRCNSQAKSGSSYGLMQINSGKNDKGEYFWCGKYGLSLDQTKCEQQLLEPKTNINVGVQILLELYAQRKNGVKFDGCSNLAKTYTGWDAALRTYNGLGCNKNYPSQDTYVEDVNDILVQIKNSDPMSISTSTKTETTTPYTCSVSFMNVLNDFDWASSSESDVACKILSETETMNGKVADTTEFCSTSGELRSCYSAVMNIYSLMGIDYKTLHYVDYYSAMANEKIGGTNILVKGETDPFTYGKVLLSEKEKLDLLKPGYQFDAVIKATDSKKVGDSNWAAHSIIFIKWMDRAKNNAQIYDWRGPGNTYHYDTMDLSNDKNFVYLIRKFPY